MGLSDDAFRPLAEIYALGALEEAERSVFDAHLRTGCGRCREAVEVARVALSRLAPSPEDAAPHPVLRQQLLDLARAPAPPIDVGAYAWREAAPGIRLALLEEDSSRHMRACLAWADPGVSHAAHRHGGDELILVLQGGVRDERGVYGPGEICRSRSGSAHTEEILDRGECFCYVLYYGELEYL